MKIGKTLYVTNRKAWRSWLAKNHKTKKEIWLVYYNKESGKARIPYNNAVEEALCYGWIDSIAKKIDTQRFTQRFSPRKSGSKWSEMNKERVRRLVDSGKMTAAGLAVVQDVLPLEPFPEKVSGLRPRGGNSGTTTWHSNSLIIASDILKALKQNITTWRNFRKLPNSYKRIRVGWIEAARKRPEIFQQRLRYFLKMTDRTKDLAWCNKRSEGCESGLSRRDSP